MRRGIFIEMVIIVETIPSILRRLLSILLYNENIVVHRIIKLLKIIN